MSDDRKKNLEGLITDGKIAEALELIKSAEDYHESEKFVRTVLRTDQPVDELVDEALEVFLNSRENKYEKHGYWVHSLSHFVIPLWEIRKIDWLAKAYKTSFQGANELNDDNCCVSLVCFFGSLSKWDDDPKDFGLVIDDMPWMDWERFELEKSRIEKGKFNSEEECLRWKLTRKGFFYSFDYDAQEELVDVEKLRMLLGQINSDEFDGLEKKLLTEQLTSLQSRLERGGEDFEKERLEAGIKKTKEQLG